MKNYVSWSGLISEKCEVKNIYEKYFYLGAMFGWLSGLLLVISACGDNKISFCFIK